MGKYGFFFTILLVLFVLDWYGYQSVKAVSQRWQYKNVAIGLYWGATLLCILGMIMVYLMRFYQYQFVGSKYINAMFLGIVIGKLLLVSMLLIEDMTRVIRYGIAHSRDERGVSIDRSQFLNGVFLTIASLPTFAFLYGVIKTAYDYQVHRHRLRFSNLPSAFSGLKVVQISDIHSGSLEDKASVARGIDMINSLKPDLFVFTGDLVNNRASEYEPWVDIFSRVQAKYGKYAILGNHDYGDYAQWETKQLKVDNLNRLKSLIAKTGWKLLLNDHELITIDGQSIAILGVENWSSKMHFRRNGDLKKAISGCENVPFKLLLSHDPSHWDTEVTSDYQGVDLTLSGHTHGMQFGLETRWFRFSPVQWVYRQWAGIYTRGKQVLNVNRGFGFLGYQGRVGIRPEITEIILESA